MNCEETRFHIIGKDRFRVVHCATQGTSFTQLMVADAMKLPAHKIIVKVFIVYGFPGMFVISDKTSWRRVRRKSEQRFVDRVHGCCGCEEVEPSGLWISVERG